MTTKQDSDSPTKVVGEIKWCENDGQHHWIKIVPAPDYKGMQCYSCPMCEQLIYWSNITERWVNVTKKGNSK